jgi:phosphoglycerol transferase MdoB-like AlkP superfamily enzyme
MVQHLLDTYMQRRVYSEKGIFREGYIQRRVYSEKGISKLIEKCRQRSPNSWYNMGFFMRILRV